MVLRVVEHVLDRVEVLLVGLDQHRVEPAPEDMVSAGVALVEGARVASVQVAHAARQVRFGGLDDQVIVVPHQAPRVDTPAVAALNPAQELEEHDAIGVVADDRGPVVSPGGDVVEGAGFENSARAGHEATVAGRSLPATGRLEVGVNSLQTRHVPGTGRVPTRPEGSRRGSAKREARPRPWNVRDAGATGNSPAPAAESAGTACPCASWPGSAPRLRRGRPPRSAPR